ncbi:Putative Ubiquitin carboxy terminal hydrolase [Rhizopus microsporus]|nr:Putative Ubiquitin carboxy terminal hydrolase [Rhizopus microsporus]
MTYKYFIEICIIRIIRIIIVSYLPIVYMNYLLCMCVHSEAIDLLDLLVPPEQIIDTVDIYHIRNRQRKISLRFLAWHLLNQDIQLETHDSIEDARTALTLYKKYLEYKNNGTFGKVLEEIYDAGHKSNWLKGAKEIKSISSAEVTPSLSSSLLSSSYWPPQNIQ